jgi:hypothetical protein
MEIALKIQGKGHTFQFFVFSGDGIAVHTGRSFGRVRGPFSVGENLKRPM